MYDQTNKLWFKIISFIVLEAFLFTIADISWAANYKERKGAQEVMMENQKTKDERDKLSADALSDKLVLTQPAMPFMGFEQVVNKGRIQSMPIIDTTISGLSIAGNDLTMIFKTLKNSGCSVSEAGFGAVRQGFNKKEIYHSLIKAGYDKDEVKKLLGGLLKAEDEKKLQESEASEEKTGPPLAEDEKEQKEEEEALKAKEGIFEIPKVTDMPVEKEPAKIIEKTTKESAVLRQTVEFVRIMINEGKRGVELIKILKKAGLTNERIINALAQMGFNLKDIITIFKEANIDCTEIVQSLHKAQINYSDKEIYAALLKAGFTDKDIVYAFKSAGISAGDILKIATDLSRNMTDIAKAMVAAGFNFADIARAYVLKAMKGVWDNTVNLVNCAVKAFDTFLTNIGRKFASKEDLAYELIVDDILATGEVEIRGKDVMTSMMAIKNVAQKYGISLEGFKLSIDSLKELDENAIILLDGDHWVTIVSIDGDKATIIDNGQEQIISLTELKIRWDGTTLALNQKELKYDQMLDLQMRQIRGGRGGIGGFFSSIWKGIKKVFKAVWKGIKKVLLSKVFKWILTAIAVVCSFLPITWWVTALIIAALSALRTYAAGGSFGDCLKTFAISFATSYVAHAAGEALSGLSGAGEGAASAGESVAQGAESIGEGATAGATAGAAGSGAAAGAASAGGAAAGAASAGGAASGVAGGVVVSGVQTTAQAVSQGFTQQITTHLVQAATSQLVGLGIQAIGKAMGLDKTAWGRVLLAVAGAVASAYVSYQVGDWMNKTWADHNAEQAEQLSPQNDNNQPGADNLENADVTVRPGDSDTAGAYPAADSNNTQVPSTSAISAGHAAPPSQTAPTPVVPYSNSDMTFNMHAAMVSAITAGAQQMAYEIAVANDWDPYATSAITTVVGALTYSLAGAAITPQDAQVWDETTRSYRTAETYGEAFSYYAKSSLPSMVSSLVEGAVNHVSQINGWDSQITSAISTSLSSFSSGMTSWMVGDPRGGPSQNNSFFEITSKALLKGAMDYGISEQADLMDMDAVDLHIMYAVMDASQKSAEAGGSTADVVTAGLDKFVSIYIKAGSFGVGTTAGTSYTNATAAYKLMKFADHIINRNTWKERDNLLERMQKAGYQLDQNGDQKKLSFWDAYLDEMSNEVSSAATAETSARADQFVSNKFTAYRINQAKEHIIAEGWGTENNGKITINTQSRADMVKYFQSQQLWNSAIDNFNVLLQARPINNIQMTVGDFKSMLAGEGFNATFQDSTVFRAGTNELADNAYTYLNTGNETSVTIVALDIDIRESNVNHIALKDSSIITTTSIAYLQGTDRLVRTTKITDSSGKISNWTVHDQSTNFLMASNSNPGLFAEFSQRKADGKLAEGDTVIYDVLFKKIDASGNISQEVIGSSMITAALVRNSNDQLVVDPQSVKSESGVLEVTMNGQSVDLAIQYNAYTGAMNIDSDRAKSIVNVGDQFQSSLNGRTYAIQLNAQNALVAVSEQTMTFDSNNRLNASGLIGVESDAYLTGSFTAVYDLTGVVSIKGEDTQGSRTGVMFKIGQTGQSFLLMNNNLVNLSGNNLSVLSGKLYSDNFNTHLKDRVELIQSGEGSGKTAAAGLNHIYLTTDTNTGDIHTNGEITIQKDKFVITNNDAIYTDANTQFTLYITDQSGTLTDVAVVGPNTAGVVIDNAYLQVNEGSDSTKITEQIVKDDAQNTVHKVTVATLNKNKQIEIKESYYQNAKKQRVVQYSMLEKGKPAAHFALPNQKIEGAYKGNIKGTDIFFDAQVNAEGTELTNVQYFINPLPNERTNIQLYQTFDVKTQTLGLDFAKAEDTVVGYKGQISGHDVFYSAQVNADGTGFDDKTFSAFTYVDDQKVNGMMYQLTRDGEVHFALEGQTVRFRAGLYKGPDGSSRTVYYNATVKTDAQTNRTGWVQSDLFVVSQEEGIQYGMLYNSLDGDKKFAFVGETVRFSANKDMQPVNAVLYADYTVVKTSEGIRMQTDGRLYSFTDGEKKYGANVELMGENYFYEFNTDVVAPIKEVNGETVYASAKMTDRELAFTGQLFVNRGGEDIAVQVVTNYTIEENLIGGTQVSVTERISTNLEEASTIFLYNGETLSSQNSDELKNISFQYNNKTYKIEKINNEYMPVARINVNVQTVIDDVKVQGALTGQMTAIYNLDNKVVSYFGQETVDGHTGIFLMDSLSQNQMLIENNLNNRIKLTEKDGVFSLDITSANVYFVDVNMGDKKQFKVIEQQTGSVAGIAGGLNYIYVENINGETHIVKSMVSIAENEIVFKENDAILTGANTNITITDAYGNTKNVGANSGGVVVDGYFLLRNESIETNIQGLTKTVLFNESKQIFAIDLRLNSVGVRQKTDLYILTVDNKLYKVTAASAAGEKAGTQLLGVDHADYRSGFNAIVSQLNKNITVEGLQYKVEFNNQSGQGVLGLQLHGEDVRAMAESYILTADSKLYQLNEDRTATIELGVDHADYRSGFNAIVSRLNSYVTISDLKYTLSFIESGVKKGQAVLGLQLHGKDVRGMTDTYILTSDNKLYQINVLKTDTVEIKIGDSEYQDGFNVMAEHIASNSSVRGLSYIARFDTKTGQGHLVQQLNGQDVTRWFVDAGTKDHYIMTADSKLYKLSHSSTTPQQITGDAVIEISAYGELKIQFGGDYKSEGAIKDATILRVEDGRVTNTKTEWKLNNDIQIAEGFKFKLKGQEYEFKVHAGELTPLTFGDVRVAKDCGDYGLSIKDVNANIDASSGQKIIFVRNLDGAVVKLEARLNGEKVAVAFKTAAGEHIAMTEDNVVNVAGNNIDILQATFAAVDDVDMQVKVPVLFDPGKGGSPGASVDSTVVIFKKTKQGNIFIKAGSEFFVSNNQWFVREGEKVRVDGQIEINILGENVSAGVEAKIVDGKVELHRFRKQWDSLQQKLLTSGLLDEVVYDGKSFLIAKEATRGGGAWGEGMLQSMSIKGERTWSQKVGDLNHYFGTKLVTVYELDAEGRRTGRVYDARISNGSLEVISKSTAQDLAAGKKVVSAYRAGGMVSVAVPLNMLTSQELADGVSSRYRMVTGESEGVAVKFAISLSNAEKYVGKFTETGVVDYSKTLDRWAGKTVAGLDRAEQLVGGAFQSFAGMMATGVVGVLDFFTAGKLESVDSMGEAAIEYWVQGVNKVTDTDKPITEISLSQAIGAGLIVPGVAAAAYVAPVLFGGASIVGGSSLTGGSAVALGLVESSFKIGLAFAAFDNAVSIVSGNGMLSLEENTKSFLKGCGLGLGMGVGTLAAGYLFTATKWGIKLAEGLTAFYGKTGGNIWSKAFFKGTQISLSAIGGGTGLTAIGAFNKFIAGEDVLNYFASGDFKANFISGALIIGGLKVVSPIVRRISTGLGNKINQVTGRNVFKLTSGVKDYTYSQKLLTEMKISGFNPASIGSSAMMGAKQFLFVGPSFFLLDTMIQNISAEVSSWLNGTDHDFFADFTWQGQENGWGFIQSMAVSSLQMAKLGLALGPMMPIFQKGKYMSSEVYQEKVVSKMTGMSAWKKLSHDMVIGPANVAGRLAMYSNAAKWTINAVNSHRMNNPDSMISNLFDFWLPTDSTKVEALANDIAFFLLMNKAEAYRIRSKEEVIYETRTLAGVTDADILIENNAHIANGRLIKGKGDIPVSEPVKRIAAQSLLSGTSIADIQKISLLKGTEAEMEIRKLLPEKKGNLSFDTVELIVNVASGMKSVVTQQVLISLDQFGSEQSLFELGTLKEGAELKSVLGQDSNKGLKDIIVRLHGKDILDLKVDAEFKSQVGRLLEERIPAGDLGITGSSEITKEVIGNVFREFVKSGDVAKAAPDQIDFLKSVLESKVVKLKAAEINMDAAKRELSDLSVPRSQALVKNSDLVSLGLGSRRDLLNKNIDEIKDMVAQTSGVEQLRLSVLEKSLEVRQSEFNKAESRLEMLRTGSSSDNYINLVDKMMDTVTQAVEAKASFEAQQVKLDHAIQKAEVKSVFKLIKEGKFSEVTDAQLDAVFGKVADADKRLNDLESLNLEQVDRFERAKLKNIELHQEISLARVELNPDLLKIHNLSVDLNVNSRVMEMLAEGKDVDSSVIDNIRHKVISELKLPTDVYAKIGTEVQEFMSEHDYSGFVDSQMNAVLDRLAEKIESSDEIKNKPEVLAKIDGLRQRLITSKTTAKTGRQLHLLKEGQFREALGLSDVLDAEFVQQLRLDVIADISQATSFESFMESKPELLKQAGVESVAALKDKAESKTEGLSMAEALVRVDVVIRDLMGIDPNTQQQRSLNVDQIEAVAAFLEGKSIEQMAGAGKTEVALTYMSIMSLVYGKKFNGLIITDSSLASAKYVERNFAGTEGVGNQEVLKAFGKKIADGSEMFRNRDYTGLEEALKDSDTIVVIDYTSFGHMHNLYYEAPKLVAQMEKINVMVADEIHMAVSGKQSYITSAEGTPLSDAKIARIEKLWEQLSQENIQAEAYDELRQSEERVYINTEENRYGISEALLSKLEKQGYRTGEIDSVLRGIKDKNLSGCRNAFGVSEEKQMIFPTNGEGHLQLNSRISDVDYTLTLALELNALAREKGEAPVVRLKNITEARTDRHTSLLEIFDKDATILGMTATAQGRRSLIEAGIGSAVKRISSTDFSFDGIQFLDKSAEITKMISGMQEKGKWNSIIASTDPAFRENIAKELQAVFEEKFGGERWTDYVEIVRVETDGTYKLEFDANGEIGSVKIKDEDFGEMVANAGTKGKPRAEGERYKVFIINERGFVGTDWQGDLNLFIADSKMKITDTLFSQLRERVGRQNSRGERWEANRFMLVDDTTMQSTMRNLENLKSNVKLVSDLTRLWDGEMYQDKQAGDILSRFVNDKPVTQKEMLELNIKVNEAVDRSKSIEFAIEDTLRSKILIKTLKLMLRDPGVVNEGNKEIIDTVLRDVINHKGEATVTPGESKTISGKEILHGVFDRVLNEADTSFKFLESQVTGERTKAILENMQKQIADAKKTKYKFDAASGKELKSFSGLTKVEDMLRAADYLGKDILSRLSDKGGSVKFTRENMVAMLERAFKNKSTDIYVSKKAMNEFAADFIKAAGENGSARLSIVPGYTQTYLSGISGLDQETQTAANARNMILEQIESVVAMPQWETASDKERLGIIADTIDNIAGNLPDGLTPEQKTTIINSLPEAFNPSLGSEVIDLVAGIYAIIEMFDVGLASNNQKSGFDNIVISIVNSKDRQQALTDFLAFNIDNVELASKFNAISELISVKAEGNVTFKEVAEVLGDSLKSEAYQEFESNWDKLSNLSPIEKGFATYYLGIKQSREGDFESAIKSFNKAAEMIKGLEGLADFESKIKFELGLAYAGFQKKEKAIEVFNALVNEQADVAPETVARAYFELAQFYKNDDQPAQAIEAYDNAAVYGEKAESLKGLVVEAYTNIVSLAQNREEFAQQFEDAKTALGKIKEADIDNRMELAGDIEAAITSFMDSMPENDRTQSWKKALRSTAKAIKNDVLNINMADSQNTADRRVAGLVDSFNDLLETMLKYREIENVNEGNPEQMSAIQTMISEVKTKIEQIGEGTIEMPAAGSRVDIGSMKIAELGEDIADEDVVVSDVLKVGFSRRMHDGTRKLIKSAEVKVVSADEYMKQQSLMQGAKVLNKGSVIGKGDNDSPIVLMEDIVIESSEDGTFKPVEAMAEDKAAQREYKFTVDAQGTQTLRLWTSPRKEHKSGEVIGNYGTEEIRMKEGSVLVEEIKEGLFVPSTAMSETDSGVEFMVKLDSSGTMSLTMVFMPEGTKLGEEDGQNIVLKQDLSLLAEDGQLKQFTAAAAGFEGDDTDRYMATLTSTGKLELSKPGSGIQSISYVGFGDERQANKNIANGMLKKALDQGKISQDEYEQRLGQAGTDLADDINVTPDRVINGSNVFIIEADFLSTTEQGEQHVSAGLRRGAEKGEVYVYITKEKYEQLSEEELVKTVKHEQAEVVYLRNEAQRRGITLESMSELLKSPDSIDAKSIINSAHEFAENIPIIEKTGMRGVSQLKTISGAELPVAVIDLGNAGFDIADILKADTTIISDKSPQGRKKQQTAQQIAELINSGEYKMIVIPGDSGDINAQELQRAYELLDIKNTKEGQITVIAHAAGTNIAADSMQFVDSGRKEKVKYLLLSPRMEADTLAAIMKDAQITPEQVMTVSEEGDFPSLLGSSDVVDTYGSANNSWTHVQIKEKEVDGKKISEIKGHSGMMIGLLEQYNDYVRINGTKSENVFSVAGIYRDFIHGEFESMAGENLGVISDMIVEILAALPKEVRDTMVPAQVYKAMMSRRKPSAESQAIFENIGSIQPASIAGLEHSIKPAVALTNL